MRLFGLIGYPLTHSFSKNYFTEKFAKEGIADAKYELFEIREALQIKDILSENPGLCGLNVTIPHKEAVIPLMDELDEPVKEIRAVNVIKVLPGKKLKGYNSDYHGFKQSLLKLLPDNFSDIRALVLGTGGASKAVMAALKDLDIEFTLISRTGNSEILSYSDLSGALIKNHRLIINTTPLGMYPQTETFPEIPYEVVGTDHFLFDLVYNPEETAFLKKGKARGARVKNGLEMLYLQAEKAWEIWNTVS